MAQTAASTAYGPIVLAAMEQSFPPSQRVISDPLAYKILPLYMRWMVTACKSKPLRNLFFSSMDKSMPGLRMGFTCRKRYIEDAVRSALESDFEAVVILGAGLDTLAYRIPELAKLPVYEVDLPENIVFKTKRLEAIFGAIPAHVTLTPIDFQQQSLDDVLQAAGYDFSQKTIFVWEAVTQYLTEDAMHSTMQVLSQAAKGSRLMFTYVVGDFIDGSNTYGLDSVYNEFVIKQKLWYFGIRRANVAAYLQQFHWSLLEDVSGAEYVRDYLRPANRMDDITNIERMVLAEKA